MNQVLAEKDVAEAKGIFAGSELLNGQYVIQARLRSGGFGMTYIAHDSLARQVVVKECFPAEVCVRRGGQVHPRSPELMPQFIAIRDQFIREARQMAKLVHPNIVAVHQVFEENNTAYMALDQIDGLDLVSLVENEPGRITNDFVKSALRQSLQAIHFIHSRGILHRDIAPDNIMVNRKDHLTLIDFGAARECKVKNRATVIAVKDGYSPYEFYMPDGVHDFSSDLYSLAATFYYLIEGTPPPSSEDRHDAVAAGLPDPYPGLAGRGSGAKPRIDEYILATIDRAMSLKQKSRFASVTDMASFMLSRKAPKGSTVAKAITDPKLESDISQLVRATNAQLSSDRPDSDKSTAKEVCKVADKQPETKKPTFDIFGNLVDDVSEWEQRQESEILAREAGRLAKAGGATAQADVQAGDDRSAIRHKRSLFGLIGKCLGGLRSQKPEQSNP